MSLIRKGLMVVLVVVLLLAVLAVTLGADALFARAIRSGGEAALGAPVTVEDTELSLLGGRAVVEGFRGGTETHPLMDFRSARFDVGVGAALAGRVHLEEATLEGLRIHLTVEEDGTLSWDPGPPPPDAERAEDPPPAPDPQAEETPAEEQDLTQILWAYWLRYQEYKPYYDKHGGFFGGGDDADGEEDTEAERQRARWPGKPEAVAQAQAADAAAAEARGSFWLQTASVEDFAWNTLDKRSGKPLLPVLASCSLRMESLGTPPDGGTMPSGISGEAALQAGGELSFDWKGSRDATPNMLSLAAAGLPVQELMPLAGSSFPWDVKGGALTLATEDLAVAKDHLSGLVRLELADATLAARPDSPAVMGVNAGEFTKLLNAALAQQPVVFLVELGGTPSSPRFKIRNETDLGDMLGGAIKAEAERRAREFVDEAEAELQAEIDARKAELEQKAEEEKENLKEKAKEELGNRVGNLFGGKKKDG